MMPKTEPAPGAPRSRRRSPWPLVIVAGLVLVALVNLLFIYIAVRGQEPVAESYTRAGR